MIYATLQYWHSPVVAGGKLYIYVLAYPLILIFFSFLFIYSILIIKFFKGLSFHDISWVCASPCLFNTYSYGASLFLNLDLKISKFKIFVEALVSTHPNYVISLNSLGRAVEHVKNIKTSDQYHLNPKKIYAMSNDKIISQFWNRILWNDYCSWVTNVRGFRL